MKEVNKKLVPKNLLEFERMFSTERECIDYIIELKYDGKYNCPKCGNSSIYRTRKYSFKCNECNSYSSILADTIFERINKPLMLYFRAIWYVVSQKNGSNAMNIQRILGLGSYNTAWAWLQKLRRAMVRVDVSKLSGTVEVDETLIGGPGTGERKKGRGSNKLLVVIGVEINNGLGRIRMRYIENASSDKLHQFIQNNIDYGSTIVTDDWNGYCGIETKGYFREIHKSKKEDDELEHIHLVASLLKRWLIGTLQGSYSQKYIDSYLDEFIFRFNRRNSKDRGLLFYRLMETAVNKSPTTVEVIKAKEKRTKPDQESSLEKTIT